ncbi:MAG: peroxiredoxin-like family protein [Chloroflexota bacterium]
MPIRTNEGNIQHTAGDLSLLRANGEAVRLASMWAERPVVLALMRHFGCIFCKDQVAQLRTIVDDIHAAGAELVIVGSGSPQMAGFFAEDYDISTPVLTDPTREVYRALEVRRPHRLAFIDPRVFVRGALAMLRGHRQRFGPESELGDTTQLGGVFIVWPGGGVAWAHRSAFAGDHPSSDAVLRALRDLTQARAA